jgi:hypothetical protein
MRVERGRRDAELRATGEITDRVGAAVAHRTIERPGGECAGLARAIGVWASLVLDEEVQRAVESAPVPPPAREPPPPPEPGWPEPALPPDRPPPESQLFLAHAKGERDLEVGATSLLMAATTGGVFAGGAVFAVVEVGAGWFLRPSLEMGRTVTSISASGAFATLGASRFDACKRIPGNYLEQRGMQLDLCAGPELGFVEVDATGPGAPPGTLLLAAFGPSIDFRGELGSALSVLIRGVAEVSVPETTANGQVSETPYIARAEVGLSWRFR